ncbi:MAG: YtxH domain-containing protein [Armatimonadetes bacterium]|nr:YtxH domain-containing protein [Armatimonadota bacterium]
MSNNNKGDFLLGLLVGASVGAAVALLYAPASGNETREQIRHTADDMTSTIRDKGSNVASRAQDLASQVKDRASSVASSVGSTVQDLRSQGQGGQQGGKPGDLPPTGEGHKTEHRDQHELRVSDDPEVVADRVNNAMQGSGEEAHEIAEQLAKAPQGRRDQDL